MNKTKLLLVEDDDALAFIVKGSLELTGYYEVCIATNGREGVDAYASFKPDVIVSDIEMPEMSGEEFVSLIRQTDKQTPILFATAKTSPSDLIRGYQFEIDNYIRKPYLAEELDAHIRGMLKRNQQSVATAEANEDVYSIGRYRLHEKHRFLQLGDTQTKLSAKETQILWMLCENKGRVVKREDILNQCWGNSDFYTSRSLDVFIRNLRKYVEKDNTVRIVTERGVGYRLISTDR